MPPQPKKVFGTDPSLISSRTSKTSSGTSTIKVYDGSLSGVNTVIAGLSSWDQWDRDDSNAPLYRLTVRQPLDANGAESLEWGWEVAATEERRDMREHPVITDLVRDMDALSTKLGTNSLLDVIKSAEDRTQLLIIPGLGELPPAAAVKFGQLYDALLRGQTHFAWPHYTLRFNATVGASFNGAINDDGALRVYSASDIISQFNNFPMYARTQARVVALQAFDPSTLFAPAGVTGLAGYTWGWLKKPMSETQLKDFKIQLSTEWDLDLWETELPTYMTL
jgi:hypothetical protein